MDWHLIKKRIRYYIPVLSWLPKYDIQSCLARDTLAAITVALLMVPQSISYSLSLVHLPAIYGLYSAFFALVIYGLLGTSRQLSVGPEALICLLIGNAIQNNVVVNAGKDVLTQKVEIAVTLALMSGLFTFALGLGRLGFLDSVLSQSLLRGFITAVAFVIFVEQSPLLLGISHDLDGRIPDHDAEEQAPFQKFIHILSSLGSANWRAVVITVGSLSYLGLFKYIKSKYRRLSMFPEMLLLVGVMSLITYMFNLKDKLDILGDNAMITGFRVSTLPNLTLTRFKNLLTPAILISILGFVEATVVSKMFAQKHQYTVSPNRELVAFGVMNIIGSLLNAFPSYASMARSHLADSAHATTPLYSIICGGFVLITILFLLPLFYYVPLCVMGSIVCWAASGLLEFEDILFWIKIGAWWPDLGMMLLAFLVTMFLGVEAAVLGSVAVSLVLVVKESTRVKMSVLVRVGEDADPNSPSYGKIPNFDHASSQPSASSSAAIPVRPSKIKYKPMEDVNKGSLMQSFITSNNQPVTEALPQKAGSSDILVVKIEEALFFANTGQLMDRLSRAEAYGGQLHTHPSEESRRVPVASGDEGQKNSFVSSYMGSKDDGVPLTAKRPLDFVNLDKQEDNTIVAPDSVYSEELNVPDEERQLLPGITQESVYHLDPHLRAIIFDIGSMNSIDASALLLLTNIVRSYKERGISVCFVKMRENVKAKFVVCGLLGDVLGSEYFFRKIADAEQYLRRRWLNMDDTQGYSTYDMI